MIKNLLSLIGFAVVVLFFYRACNVPVVWKDIKGKVCGCTKQNYGKLTKDCAQILTNKYETIVIKDCSWKYIN